MKDGDRKKIEEIMAGMQCPKNFRCSEGGFEHLCKATDIGLDNYLNCLEKNPANCPFALSFALRPFCQCPLRVYLAKKLKK
jgi:hypothetical protein